MVNNSLKELGYREIDILGKTLMEYARAPRDSGLEYGDEIAWGFNPNSGFLYLYDETGNVAILNGNKLEPFFACSYCGHEGFKDEFDHETKNAVCCTEMDRVRGLK